MEINEISRLIVDAACRVHRDLGPGLLESVYEIVLADALRDLGLKVERQKPIPIRFESKTFDEGFRADMVVEGVILVELKSVEQLARVQKKQTLTYLKLGGFRVGLLINFGGELLKGNIERLVAGKAPDLLQPSASSALEKVRTERTENTEARIRATPPSASASSVSSVRTTP